MALYFARQYGGLLRGVVLVDGGIMDLKTQWPTWEIAEKQMMPPVLTQVTLPEIQQRIKQQWLSDAWTPEAGELALQVYKVDANGFVSRRLNTANHMQIARAIWSLTPAEHFGKIQCPILLVMPTLPGMSQPPEAWQTAKQQQVAQAAKMIKDCQVVWFPDTIHDIPWQRPEQLAGVLTEFIATHQIVGLL